MRFSWPPGCGGSKVADTPFLQLSERWRLAYDSKQWIVQRRSGSDGKDMGERWRSKIFISSKRSTLIRYMLEDGAVVDDWRVIAMLPDTFQEWVRTRAEAANKAAVSAEVASDAGTGLSNMSERDGGVETVVA